MPILLSTMSDHTSNPDYAGHGNDLRPWIIAVVMIGAGLGLLFWDNDQSDNSPAPLVVVSHIR